MSELDERRGGGVASFRAGARAAGSAAAVEAEPLTEGPLVVVIGPCGAGKSALVAALRQQGVRAREVAQEHSYVPDMWMRLARPDLVVYLDVSREVAEGRLDRSLPAAWWTEMGDRLAHARSHADLIVDTDPLTQQEVVRRVLKFLKRRR